MWLYLNSMKLVIQLHLISWKKTPNDAVTPQRQSQFTPKLKANMVPRLLSSLVWNDHYNERNGMTSYMEFMFWRSCLDRPVFIKVVWSWYGPRSSDTQSSPGSRKMNFFLRNLLYFIIHFYTQIELNLWKTTTGTNWTTQNMFYYTFLLPRKHLADL